MNIGILAVDSNFPNLALMKISAYHKARGDQVEWYNPLCKYDKVYAAKVFTFTPDYNYYINANQIEKGGTGYDIEKVLPIEVDRLQPDYSIYNIDSNLSYGFLTRGCPNRCKWCVVPKKEGKISPYMDIEEITAGRRGRIWLNPPYSKPLIWQFVEKLAEHGNGIALLFNRCDSNKFQDIIFTKATGMMFLRNRIKFFRPDGTRGDSPGCGSVLIAFGRENAEILRNCSLQGKYVELNNDK